MQALPIQASNSMKKILASVAFLIGWASPALADPPSEDALWTADKRAAVSAMPGVSGTQVTAYVRQADGRFLEVDLSAVEGGNFGKLGRRRAEYDRFETKPVEWIPRQDGLFQVKVQTQAWLDGQRYTVWEPVLFRADGTVFWR